MSTKHSYFCDQCKQEVSESTELTRIKLELNPYSSYKPQRFETTSQYYEICEKCTERLGFTLRKKVAENTVIETTTAEKLYEIIAQMISERS